MSGSLSYNETVDGNGIFDNDCASAYPQTIIADLVRSHFSGNGERKKRVLIYGYDGCRADSMCYIIPSNDRQLTGHNFESLYSGITEIRKEGGLYLTYAGGDSERPETLQEVSTPQGWSSILTGKWVNETEVTEQTSVLSLDAPTVLLEASRKGRSGLFASMWAVHFMYTYKAEIEIAKKENLPLEFKYLKNELEIQRALLDAVDSGTDIIFGINEFADENGHRNGFGNDNYRYVTGVTNADRYAYELIDCIKNRPSYSNEDWLIILTSDHGGHGLTHGAQCDEDRMTFLAVNKRFDSLKK